jgi:superfamily II DNA or RNA helicase
VRIRDQRWRIVSESRFGAISIVDVDGGDRTNAGVKARFLLPFETVTEASRSLHAARFVTIERWRRAARSTLAAAVPTWTSLRAATRANIAILPFQLEPAMAIVRGDTCRVLIADEVGLGKTIQAGLILAETLTRNPDARVLIVAPAGLREQWRDELNSRFHARAETIDASSIARMTAELAADVNPWSIHAVAITSIDYIKRPEVMRSLETLAWDIVVFDEAHTLAGRSDRAAAAAALARRARLVIMLTATPHSGDEEAFARLSAIGDIEGAFPLMTFRRTRADVGLPQNRRSAVLRVRPTSQESAMHEALSDYLRRLAQEPTHGAGTSLLSSVLLRRACSSAASLARSIERRTALLLDRGTTASEQLPLPFVVSDSDDEPAFELGVAGLGDAEEEQRWLRRLMDLAGTAINGQSKISLLRRLLRRIDEPAIIFTEYRDTLQDLAAALQAFAPLTLHGGLPPRERAAVIARFNDGRSSLLLATDAASEGLNLQRRCRLVISLEIPWTPLRLEQRIGRVDRIGQARRVHALSLIANGTHDEVMARLFKERMQRIGVALDRPHNRCERRDDAAAEAARVDTARRLAGDLTQPAPPGGALLTVVRRSQRTAADVRAFQLTFVDESGRLEFETVAGVMAADQLLQCGTRADVAAAKHHQTALFALLTELEPWLELSLRREHAIADDLRQRRARLSAELLQPGLFERRAERAVAAQTVRVDEAIGKSQARLGALDRLKRLRCGDHRLLLAIRFLA